MRPLALLLDLDETLLDDNSSYERSIAEVSAGLASSFPGFDFANLFDVYQRVSNDYWQEVAEAVMRGRLEGDFVRRESWRRALEHCGCKDGSLADTALAAYSRSRRESYTLFDDAVDLLSSLPSGVTAAIVTNGSSDTQWEKIRKTDLEKYVAAVLVSGDIGVAKPDPEIFLTALERLGGIAPAQAAHVGDSLYADIGGAEAAGLTSVWLNRDGMTRGPGDPMPRHEISSLSELRGLLEL